MKKYLLFFLFFLFALNLSAQVPLTIRAEWFDRGNVTRGGALYSDKYVCLCTGGQAQTFVEFDVDFPQAGVYEFSVLYTAGDSRPMLLTVDGKDLGMIVSSVNGSWQTSQAKWEKQRDLKISKAGKTVVRLSTKTIHIPHLCALKFTPLFTKTINWPVPRPIAQKEVDKENQWQPTPWSGGWYLEIARDRAQKKESGETFDNHFALETSLALVPKKNISFELFRIDPRHNYDAVQLNDELTYCSGMFDKQKKFFDPEIFYLDLKIEQIKNDSGTSNNAGAADTSFSNPPQLTQVTVSRKKFAELIRRTLDLIKYFREDLGDDNYLNAEEKQVKILQSDLKNFDALFASTPQTFNNHQIQKEAHLFVEKYMDLIRLYSQTALSNPLLDFDKLLFIKRHSRDLGLPYNYESNSILNKKAFDDTLMTLELPNGRKNQFPPKMKTLFKPAQPAFLGDIDLHFDAEKALVSTYGKENSFNVFELDLKGAASGKPADRLLKQLLPQEPEAEHYDACYLPDDSMIFTSSMCYTSVPCMQGTRRVTNTYRQNKDGSIRRLTFDQEHNWCPTLMPNGQVLYNRWEYTDVPHVPGRILFTMNPDGTLQRAFYGSNSLWPVSMMYARPIPGSTTKFAAIVTGHHGVPRMGELVLFDVEKGRTEELGAVQRICGAPKFVKSRTNKKYFSTLTGDNIVDESWPKFLHPYPLSEDFYLVAAQPNRYALWGIYLVDRFDNMILLAEDRNFACFEPIPWKKTDRPPMIMDRVDLTQKDATVYIQDLYNGQGLPGVPKGTVKKLRLYSYSYHYPENGGQNAIIGVDGPWDVRQVIGTVPVNPDGSALFTVPANTPIAIQPIDENGAALQQMRSWFTGMPGEFVSCIGCHEDQNSTSTVSSAAFRTNNNPAKITPWYGPMRGFSYEREVQPVLDYYCIACHDGQDHHWGVVPFDLRGGKIVSDYKTAFLTGRPHFGKFSTSYLNMHQYVRRMGLESDFHVFAPCEYSANTTELFQILKNDHYGLQLDAEAWDRIITWIDMNAPYYGTWSEYAGRDRIEKWDRLRQELLKKYANIDDVTESIRGQIYDPVRAGKLITTDHSIIPVNPFINARTKKILNEVASGKRAFPSGKELKDQLDANYKNLPIPAILEKPIAIGCESPKRYQWSRKAAKNKDRDLQIDQSAAVKKIPANREVQKIDLAPNVPLYLTKISQKESGLPKDLWFGTFEITNEQFELFDPSHDSRVESRLGLSHGIRGFYVNGPKLPVCRVSWHDAQSFCNWLSKKTGKKFRLPTEKEWTSACLSGAKTPFAFGDWGADFSKDANLADQMLIEFVIDLYYAERRPMNASYYDDWIPKDRRFCDDGFLSERPGIYRPNRWGLFDMHGNVAEWTACAVLPGTGIPSLDSEDQQYLVLGGSWHDRPYRAAAGFKTSYRSWQRVFDTGIRVICEE